MKYEAPKMEKIEITSVDVITASGVGGNTTPDDEL